MVIPPILTLGLGIFPIVALVGAQLTVAGSITQTCVSVMSGLVGLPFSAMASLNTLLANSILPFIVKPIG